MHHQSPPPHWQLPPVTPDSYLHPGPANPEDEMQMQAQLHLRGGSEMNGIYSCIYITANWVILE